MHHNLYAIGSSVALEPQGLAVLTAMIDRARLINAAEHLADIEDHARCMSSQWHDLRDARGRLAEAADVAATRAGHPERARDAADLAMIYARAQRRSLAAGKRNPYGAAWRRWQGKAMAACDALIAITG